VFVFPFEFEGEAPPSGPPSNVAGTERLSGKPNRVTITVTITGCETVPERNGTMAGGATTRVLS
jgi:hypothetical protein